MAKQQKVVIKIPKGYGPEERQAISAEVIDYIIERTEGGKDKDEAPFKPGKYSKQYKDSLDFKIAGKSEGKINLTLSGEMLNSLKLLNHKNGAITLGYDKGEKELNGKVEGNRIGSYGGKPNSKVARDFLGIKDDKLKSEVLGSYPLAEKGATQEQKTESLAQRLSRVVQLQLSEQTSADILRNSGFIIEDDE